MGYIITINSESKQALALLEIAKTFDFTEITKVKTKPKKVLTAKEKNFLKRLNRSATHAKEIAEGKRKGNSVNALLNEI
ncbi:hypothetical protein CAPN004_02350 [Capnocytophaga cynodegmi]|uniref:Uncharacterized protein n=1 Tax=Capnocytophaga cynodegmi TaxID=28189 RepID=A0A250E6E9_9FLAO|nr:hypothetical protein [Capnocytophaga cynodegmi]ATA67296.1 hypothetical protein CGC48_00870 [Capnocytophaga cynodegmi]GIM51205.1 hypothetical protein CAPN004_02350 [Capnocytophaga cynodegmi]